MQGRPLRTGVNLLKIFLGSLLIDCLLLAVLLPGDERGYALLAVIALFLGITECVIFWAGIILIYVSSSQLGMKMRILGIICGWIPIINLIVLTKMIGICSRELAFEKHRSELDMERAGMQVCRTKYPILLVHGVFFRDFEHFNYWGRIPKALEANGATIFYGEHNSANAVKDSADELEKRVKEIMQQTGCEKVNIIAHSKGGLDSRMMISRNPSLVASLTTINTPHRGCEFADYLFGKVPEDKKKIIADTYNSMASKMGDKDPDFLSAVYDLTSSRCAELNKEMKDAEGVYYQSVGSILKRAVSGRFPLNFTYNLVKYFDGPNDGLVGINSFGWGSSLTILKNDISDRGISHGDVIDLNRENIKGFDVREFYINLVSDLREKGF